MQAESSFNYEHNRDDDDGLCISCSCLVESKSLNLRPQTLINGDCITLFSFFYICATCAPFFTIIFVFSLLTQEKKQFLVIPRSLSPYLEGTLKTQNISKSSWVGESFYIDADWHVFQFYNTKSTELLTSWKHFTKFKLLHCPTPPTTMLVILDKRQGAHTIIIKEITQNRKLNWKIKIYLLYAVWSREQRASWKKKNHFLYFSHFLCLMRKMHIH